MIVVANRIPVNPEYAEAFEQRFMDRERQVDGMPGFISFQILRPSVPEDPYVVMTFWETRESYETWISSEAFKQGHAQPSKLPRDAFLGHPKIEVHEVIQSTVEIRRPTT